MMYLLQLSNGLSLTFAQLSGNLTSETTVIEQRVQLPNGKSAKQALPGASNYHTVQLTRPLTANLDLTKWRATIESGKFPAVDAVLTAYDQNGQALLTWNLKGVFPAQLDVITNDNNILLEEVIIAHAGIQLQ